MGETWGRGERFGYAGLVDGRVYFFFSSRRRHTRYIGDWSSDVCSSDLAALQAGKHVYCEAPLANDLEEARAIAQAAKNALKLNFQVGLQNRSDPHRHFLVQFVRAEIGRASCRERV